MPTWKLTVRDKANDITYPLVIKNKTRKEAIKAAEKPYHVKGIKKTYRDKVLSIKKTTLTEKARRWIKN